jgi:hypothetical protein
MPEPGNRGWGRWYRRSEMPFQIAGVGRFPQLCRFAA